MHEVLPVLAVQRLQAISITAQRLQQQAEAVISVLFGRASS
jgi:hypothetical protein